MTEILAIAGAPQDDNRLALAVARRHPAVVTVLVESDGATEAEAWGDSPIAAALRTRLLEVMARVEMATGAVVAGVIAERDALGERFDAVVDATPAALAA